MRRTMIACLAVPLLGCAALPSSNPTNQSDIRNWDFTACLDDVGTCADLLLDNQEVILGGYMLVGFIIEGLGNSESAAQRNSESAAQIDLGFLPPPPLPDAPNQADIKSWDFTACLDDLESFSTCYDLLFDNAGIILGGLPLVENIAGGWTVP